MDKEKQIKSDFTVEASKHGLTITKINNKKIEVLNVPEGITYIGNPEASEFIFSDCSKLSEIHLPTSLKRIEHYAFNGLSSLKKINIPKSVEFIGSWAFEGCKSLTELYIPDTVHSLGTGLFSGCTNLKQVHLPEKLSELPDNLFSGCTNLDYNFLEIPDSVTKYGCEVFARTSFSEFWIGENVTSVGRGAFADCKNLTFLEIPDSVTQLGQNLFGNTTGTVKTKVNLSSNIVRTDIDMIYDTTLKLFQKFPKLYKIEKEGITNLTLNKKIENEFWNPEDFE